MSPDSLSFASMSPSSSIHVMIAYGTHISLIGVGYIVTPHLSLSKVYLILNLTLNLAFIGQIYDFDDYLVIFFSFFFVVCRIYILRS
jgi:hypothetical protein